MRILLWHVHGSWTTSFVQGGHDYLLPLTPGRYVVTARGLPNLVGRPNGALEAGKLRRLFSLCGGYRAGPAGT